MSASIEGLVIPITARLKIEEAVYELTAFEITYVVNGPIHAECNLAVGFKGDNSGTVGAMLLPHTRGTVAIVEITIADSVEDPVSRTILVHAGTFDAFTGVLDDQGPGNLSKGNFNLRVSLVSKLAILATGTLQLSRLISTSYLDTAVPLSIINHAADHESSPGGGAYNAQGLTDDFWAETKRVLHLIATSGTTGGTTRRAVQDFKLRFGEEVNTEADKIISELGGALHFGKFNIPEVVLSLRNYLNDLFSQDFAIQSFYNRIVSLGQEFKFRIIENFDGAKVVPYSPFFPATLAKPIYPSTITDMNWANREPNSVLGCAMILTGPCAINANIREDSFLIGAYKRPINIGNAPLGAIVTIPSPPWMASKRYDKEGYTYYFRVPATILQELGDAYAKEQTLELAYRGYGVQVMCPFRTDIGIGDPVRILYPTLPGTDLGPSVYGSVQMVKLCMDAVKKQAYTVMEVGYARSEKLQTLELSEYTHPVWTTQYGGGRLDGVE